MEYIIGILVSLILQWFKKFAGTSTLGTYSFLAILAIIGSVAYYFLEGTEFWTSLSQILLTAGAFHNFIIRLYEKASE